MKKKKKTQKAILLVVNSKTQFKAIRQHSLLKYYYKIVTGPQIPPHPQVYGRERFHTCPSGSQVPCDATCSVCVHPSPSKLKKAD